MIIAVSFIQVIKTANLKCYKQIDDLVIMLRTRVDKNNETPNYKDINITGD